MKALLFALAAMALLCAGTAEVMAQRGKSCTTTCEKTTGGGKTCTHTCF